MPLNVSSPSHELARELAAVSAARAARVAGARRSRAPRRDPTRGRSSGRACSTTSPTNRIRSRRLRARRLISRCCCSRRAPRARPSPRCSRTVRCSRTSSRCSRIRGCASPRPTSRSGCLPFFHVYGLNVVLGLALHAGGAVALVDHFHPAESLERVRVDGGDDDRGGAVDLFRVAGARATTTRPRTPSSACASAFRARPRFRPKSSTRCASASASSMHNGYGLTEASPVVTTTAVVVEPRAGSVGPPLPGVEVRLVDTDGNEVLEGDPGEILVRGPNVFAGYWNDHAATDAVLADGWLHTGDIGVADSDGWLTLVDRAKDVIIVSGFNVFPGEVEDALRSHDECSGRRGHRRTASADRRNRRRVRRSGTGPYARSGRALAARGPAARARTSCRRASRSSTRCRARSRASWCDASSPIAPANRPTRRRSPRRSPRYQPRARSRSSRRRRSRLAAIRRSTR